MRNKARLNYWVDILIAAAFAAAVVSGFVLFFAGSGGYQGGRNPRHAREVLWLSRWVWKEVHDWSGIAMSVGVALHFLLHWGWLKCMTRNLFRRTHPAASARAEASCPLEI